MIVRVLTLGEREQGRRRDDHLEDLLERKDAIKSAKKRAGARQGRVVLETRRGTGRRRCSQVGIGEMSGIVATRFHDETELSIDVF